MCLLIVDQFSALMLKLEASTTNNGSASWFSKMMLSTLTCFSLAKLKADNSVFRELYVTVCFFLPCRRSVKGQIIYVKFGVSFQ